MAKIMLVEDDNNLREIYQARLSSEGFETVTASDGEEALSIVSREKPDLIILDVMMPKISGFDTLDLLKNNPLTKDIKVIMMTALSQAEDRARAEKLGAQNYLVKSQVTLEDIVKAVKDTLAGDSSFPGESSAQSTTPTTSVFNNNQGDHSMTPTTPDPDQSSNVTPDPMSTMTHGNAGADNMATVNPMAEPSATPSMPTNSDMSTPTSNDTSMPSTPAMDPPTGITDFSTPDDSKPSDQGTSLSVDHQDDTASMPMSTDSSTTDMATPPAMDPTTSSSPDNSSSNTGSMPSMEETSTGPTVTPTQTFFTPQPMQSPSSDSNAPTNTPSESTNDQDNKSDAPVDSTTGAL